MDDQERFLCLQNGSDIRGVACEGVPGESVNLTSGITTQIGRAFARFLAKRSGKPASNLRISVGMDSRITGPAIKEAFMRGLGYEDVQIMDCALATTPAMFMSIVYEETRCDGACMVTASHLPFNRNGLKFFTPDGGLEKDEIRALLEMAAELAPPSPDKAPREGFQYDLLSLYADKLTAIIRTQIDAQPYDKPLSSLHIVVDAGNGNGGFFATKILKDLGADTKGSQFLNPDGHFPNHVPNPEDPEAMQSICKAVTDNHADLGLIFDTDVDRMSAVLSDGTPVNRDSIIAMMAAILAPDYPGSTIITDSVTSDRLTEFLEKDLGLIHLRYKRGYKNVIDKCKELNAAGTVSPLAMETSGHGCLKENYYLDDGAYLAVKLLVAVAQQDKNDKTIDHLIDGLSKEYQAKEVRFKITMDDFHKVQGSVLSSFKEAAEKAGYALPKSYEGIRIRFDKDPKGWMLLRASLHDPVMVLNMEGHTKEDLDQIRDIAGKLIGAPEGLDLSAL